MSKDSLNEAIGSLELAELALTSGEYKSDEDARVHISDAIRCLQAMEDASIRKDEAVEVTAPFIGFCKQCGQLDVSHVCISTQPSEISIVDRLIGATEDLLAYFCDEFPKNNAKNLAIWASPVSYHCGGVSPNDLESILSILRTTKPVSTQHNQIATDQASVNNLHEREPVSVEICAKALFMANGIGETYWEMANKKPFIEKTKAILDAVGVKYVD